MFSIFTDRAWCFRVEPIAVNEYTVIRPYWIQESSVSLSDDEIRDELTRVGLQRCVESCLAAIKTMEEMRKSWKI